jgi:hypothetical protein
MVASTPLTPAVFAILLSLAAGDRHGYAMMVESDNSDHERRRYYSLTTSGRVALETELSRLDFAVTSARERGLLPHGGHS